MTYYSDLMNSGEDLLFGAFGGSSVTFGDGTTNVAITDAWKGDVSREADPGRATDVLRVAWRFRASQLSTINLSPGNTVTEGAAVWQVDPEGVTFYGQGEFASVQTSRRVQRGAA